MNTLSNSADRPERRASARRARLISRPTPRPAASAADSAADSAARSVGVEGPLISATTPVHVGGRAAGLLHQPPPESSAGQHGASSAYRLVVLLHGAGGRAGQALDLLAPYAAAHRLLLYAPQSLAATWDAVLGRTGPDVARLDAALEQVFGRYDVEPGGVAVGGFSDGASYALTLGVANGDLFSGVLAFSPGFVAPATAHGRPRFFVTHGVGDAVLPIDRTSRSLVPALRRAGYDVTYREFAGPHVVPPDQAAAALAWWLGEPASPSAPPRAEAPEA